MTDMLFSALLIAGYFMAIWLIARSKNRRVWVWLLFGLVFPVLSLVILMFAYPLKGDGEHETGVG
ncbi:MAG: putative alpha/beta hydrolase [Yoonia sp.]|jgi:predicted alpha/beta hydrolase